jgi:2-polyprenyl-3-methyl-5-hydroxy-6-metoxy-1,4-benzoquinol methylase
MDAGRRDGFDKPKRYYEAIREDMLRYIPRGVRTTLEFGCGCGGFSALLKSRLGTESWAVEINEAVAREAAARLDKVIPGDALASIGQIPDGYFDCIIFFDILEHLIDPYRLLAAARAKLTPAGVVVASIPNIRFYRTLVALVVHGNWEYEDEGILDRTHLRFFTRKSIVHMFEERGFRILTLEGINPTVSRTYRLLNLLSAHALADVRYRQFVVVAALG